MIKKREFVSNSELILWGTNKRRSFYEYNCIGLDTCDAVPYKLTARFCYPKERRMQFDESGILISKLAGHAILFITNASIPLPSNMPKSIEKQEVWNRIFNLI